VETEGGDWHHDEDREPGTEGPSYGRLIIGLLIGIALVLALTRPLADRLVLDEGPTTGLRLELYPGSPGITLGETSLYPKNDPWSAWLANEASCPGGEETVAPAAVQVQVLLCLVNYAREYEGVQPVALSPLLSTTAAAKARDIVLCHDFSHEACGKPPFQAADDLGYRGSIGENLYVGEGALEAPRLAVDTWLNSPGHRENMLQADWRTVGISLLPGANLDDIDDGVVWVNHFGP
jgi:uncharacterized protein YkwD